MGRPNESVEEDVADPPGIDLQNKRRRLRRRAWRDGLADQTVVHALEDVRCYRAFERALVRSVDPRSVLELARRSHHGRTPAPSRNVSCAFSNLDPTLLGRVGSCETRLLRQAAQTIWTLEAMRQPPPPMRQRLRNRAAPPFPWDRQR
jgi:hypothetical protein